MPVLTGLDLVDRRWPRSLKGARAGLLIHPASVNRHLLHASDVLTGMKQLSLRCLFGPQHGILGQTQDNMIEWEGFRDGKTGLPVYSLYGRTRKPSPPMLEDIDVLVIDLQDVGARYYTFIWTMDLCMEACAEAGKAVVVLDRPNPINGTATEGPVLDPAFSSFVGLRPLPVRHGMTIGEIGAWLAGTFHRPLDYHVIPIEGWTRDLWFNETGLPWVMPSPNMPTPDTALVYPGMCLLEGTLLSEGRGTTRPFEIFGAPFIEPEALVRSLEDYRLPGVRFRPLSFEPTFQKHAGRLCGGAQIHVTNRRVFRPFKTAVAIIRTVRQLYPEEMIWRDPPYEYETEKLPFDILAGTDRLRLDIDRGVEPDAMEAWWQPQCRQFSAALRKRYLFYD